LKGEPFSAQIHKFPFNCLLVVLRNSRLWIRQTNMKKKLFYCFVKNSIFSSRFIRQISRNMYIYIFFYGYEMFDYSIGNNDCNTKNKQSLMMVSNLLPFENNCNNELLMYVCHSNIICDDFLVEFNWIWVFLFSFTNSFYLVVGKLRWTIIIKKVI
jgi:hypothetical protein